MRNYPTIAPRPVHMNRLYCELIGKPHKLNRYNGKPYWPNCKLPADFTCDGFAQLHDSDGNSLGHFHITITRAGRQGVPRSWAHYGTRLVPLGRLAQAKV